LTAPRRSASIAAMSANSGDQPAKGDSDAAGERQARLAAALRENLHRRKAQARARAGTPAANAAAAADDGTGRGGAGSDEPETDNGAA